MPTVQLTRHLHAFFPSCQGQALRIEGSTVAEVVRGMEAIAPGFGYYVCDERGRLRAHVNVFVDGRRVSDRETLADAVGPDSRVFIVQALSGG